MSTFCMNQVSKNTLGKLLFTECQRNQILVDQQHFMWYPWHIIKQSTTNELIASIEDSTMWNIGDPYAPGNITISSYQQEQWVVEYYGHMFDLKEDETWWFVWPSWTLWNMQWLKMARDKYPQWHVFYSQDAHYSVGGGAHLMTWCDQYCIASQSHGEIDYDKLKHSLQDYKAQCDLSSKLCQPIIVLTLGTTVTWAIDQPVMVLDIFKELGIDQHYIHIDAALAWWFWPFIEDDCKPYIGFDIAIDSMSISWHKFIGSKYAAWIFICRKSLRDEVMNKRRSNSEYIGTRDITISGTRNAHSPIYLADSILKRQHQFGSEISQCLTNSDYLIESINRHMPRYQPWRNPYSTTVVFSKPSDRIVKKYSLACTWNIAHVVVMQHVSKALIDEFVGDLSKDWW